MSEEQMAERLREVELQNALLAQDVKQLNAEINKLNGGIGRALWIIGGGFLTSFVVWFTSGGIGQ